MAVAGLAVRRILPALRAWTGLPLGCLAILSLLWSVVLAPSVVTVARL
jgi:hypothetical protein